MQILNRTPMGCNVSLPKGGKEMLAKLTSKNQLTLPRDIIKEFKGIEIIKVADFLRTK